MRPGFLCLSLCILISLLPPIKYRLTAFFCLCLRKFVFLILYLIFITYLNLLFLHLFSKDEGFHHNSTLLYIPY